MKNGKRNGFGTQIFHNGKYKGDKYEGEWLEGKITGKGIYSWGDGNKYEG